MIEVDVQNLQRFLTLDEGQVARWAKSALERLGRDPAELSVVLLGDEEIRELNRQYLGRDRPTNVISFPQQEGEGLGGMHLGDIVISVERAVSEAQAAGMDPRERFVELLIHGICHLTGFDHEGVAPSKAYEMECKERELFEGLMRGE